MASYPSYNGYPWTYIFRLATFGTCISFSLILLGLCGHLISVTVSNLNPPFYYVFSALGVATSILTLFTLPLMIVVEQIRKGTIISQVIFEVAWTGTLAVLWLATAGSASRSYHIDSPFICFVGNFDFFLTICRETRAVQAFAHLGWVCLFTYTFTLTYMAFISKRNGRDVWYNSVKDSQFLMTGPTQTLQPQPQTQTQPVYYQVDPSKIPLASIEQVPQAAVFQQQPDFAPQFQGQPQGYAVPEANGYPRQESYVMHANQTAPSATTNSPV
ncbi:hypothetical protein C8Q75DRAFT_197617 [Abortiporus biennis]|nr:hypothetical protein C8Q75DRAFT_197617 [Abortiporus biennis]